jgi:SAM-dependent methyltransferase
VAAKYDTIGINYAQLRKPDPRLAEAIHQALGEADTVLNVGAGAGSYEPADRKVTAVEPSIEMIRKRPPTGAPVVQGSADCLPFDDDAFDASMAILTIHHWPDKEAGLKEMRRVTRGPLVLLTFDPSSRPWLTDYLPQLARLDEAQMPTIAHYERWLGPIQVTPLPLPHDCTDGFLYAYWRRPYAYLDPFIRSGISSFWAIRDVDRGLGRLRRDLDTGDWQRCYASVLSLDEYDAGYRLISST